MARPSSNFSLSSACLMFTPYPLAYSQLIYLLSFFYCSIFLAKSTYFHSFTAMFFLAIYFQNETLSNSGHL